MKTFNKLIISLFIIIGIHGIVLAQATLTIGSVSGNPGTTVSVPVNATGIKDMQGFQFTIVYDANKLEYENCSDWSGGTEASGVMINPMDGKVAFVYNEKSNKVNITSGKFFDINFKVKEVVSGDAAISWSDNPTKRELSNSVPEIINCTYTAGKISISNTSPLKADFTVDTTSGPAPLTVHFTDKSLGNPTSWKWNFGDGSTDTIQNPTHTYQTPGLYTVSLSVADQYRSDSVRKIKYISVHHFNTIWTGNPYQPMNILVKSADIYGVSLKINDEIGVFVKDSLGKEICVGDGQVTASIKSGQPLNITVSFDDPTTSKLDGFRDGETIYYKIWSGDKQLIFSNVSSQYDTAYDQVFTPLGTAVVSLSAYGHYHTVWNGNPYQPMNILIDSILLPDSGVKAGDEVGVFDKDDAGNSICVGVGVIQGTVSSKSPLTIVASSDDPGTKKTDGFIKGHRITYKVWSSGSQKEYVRFNAKYNPGLDSLFSPLGTVLVSLKYQTSIVQNITLSTGWNMMSFNVIPDTLNMLSMLRPLISVNHLIKVIDEKGGFIQNIPGVGWMNTIGDMANTEGYYIKVSENDTLTAKGKPVVLPFDIPLQTGWNMMGYPLLHGQDAKVALQILIDSSYLVKVINEAGKFIQNIPGVGWMNTIGNFEPGEGYYIKVNANTRLTLNNQLKETSTSDYASTLSPLTTSKYFNKVFQGNPYYPMNIVVTDIDLGGFTVQPGDEVAVFDKDVCVGVGKISEDVNSPVNIVASLDDPLTEQKDGYVIGDPVSIRYMSSKLNSPIDVSLNTLSGLSRFTPLETVVYGITASPDAVKRHLKSQGYELRIYPNPAKTVTTFEINNVKETHVRIEIMNLNGKVVAVLYDKILPKGNARIRYNTTTLPSGIYSVRVIRRIRNQTTLNSFKLVITR